MNDPSVIEYREANCVFLYDREKDTLRVKGTPERARPVILKLRKEGFLKLPLRAIWFSADVPLFYAGINLTLFLASAPPPKKTDRSFRDIVNS